jgi:hypothetical protein
VPGLLDDDDFDPADDLTPEEVEAIRQSLRGDPAPSNRPRGGPVPSNPRAVVPAVERPSHNTGEENKEMSVADGQESSSDSNDSGSDVDTKQRETSAKSLEPSSSPLRSTGASTIEVDDEDNGEGEVGSNAEVDEELGLAVEKAEYDNTPTNSGVGPSAVSAGVDDEDEEDGSKEQDGPTEHKQAAVEEQATNEEALETLTLPHLIFPTPSTIETPAESGNTPAPAASSKDPTLVWEIQLLKDWQEAKKAEKAAAAAKKATAAAEKKAMAGAKKAGNGTEEDTTKAGKGGKGGRRGWMKRGANA